MGTLNAMTPQLRTGMDLTPGLNAMMRKPILEQQYQQNQQNMQTGQIQNALMQKRLANYDEDRKLSKEDRKMKKVGSALSAALKGKTPDQAKEIYKTIYPDAESIPDFSFIGEDVSITYPDGAVIKGPGNLVSEFAETVGKDPGWANDPAKAQQAVQWLGRNGVSFQFPQKGETAQDKLSLYENKKKIDAKYKDKTENKVTLYNMSTGKTEEHSKKEAEKLQAKHPNTYMTSKQRQDLAKTARDKVPQIKKAMAEFGKAVTITEQLAAQFPDDDFFIGQKIDEKTRKEVVASMKKQLKYYEQFLPEDNSDPLGLGL